MRRAAFALLATGAFALGLILAGVATWQLWAFAIAPDLTFLAGLGGGTRPGQLHPRAVPLYNAVHRLWVPLALGASATATVSSAPPERGSRFQEMVAAARELLETEGHVASGMRELAEGRREALRGATGVLDALTRLAVYQREFAARHRHLYRLMFDRPFPPELVAAQMEAHAWRPVVELLGSVERHWAAFAFAHGMLELERTGRLRPGSELEAV